MAELYDLNAPVSAAQAQRVATQQLLAGQDVKTAEFLKRYGDIISGQGTTQAAAERIGQELGLPGLQKTAFGLQQQVLGIPETYKAGTRGFDVNANQLARIINARTAELQPLAERATAQAQFAQGQLGTRLGYQQADWARQLLPLTTEQSFLQDRMARETSMYSQDNQNELNAILEKVRNGITLSEGEKNRAQQLAIAEKGYENALKQIAETAKYKTDETKSPWQSVGEKGWLYNIQTGQKIYGAGGGGGGSDPLGLRR